MTDALVARPFEFSEREAGRPVGLVKLFGSLLRIPLRFERRQSVFDLFKANSVGTLVRSGVGRIVDLAVRHDTRHDLRQIQNAIVMSRLTDIERLIEQRIGGGLKSSGESHRDVRDVSKTVG